MKYFLKVVLIVTFTLGFNESRANTLFDSLNSAYLNNHKLNAERANMRASREEKRESVSEFLPSVTISGYVSEQDNTGGSVSNFKPSEQSLEIEQKIFQGFSGVSNLRKKMYGQDLAEFKLKKVEQETLLAAAKAHTDLLLNIKKVNINLMNIDLLERQVENFKKREVKELQNLERIALKEERSDYAGLQARIEKLKEKYRAIRDQKIKERVEALGVAVQEGDDRDALLEKEKQYTLERQKIENCLESFYRSSVSLCFQINKRYIPKHRSILRVIDLRFEQSEIYIRWDDAPEEDWLLLIYIKNNSPEEGIVIEDKTDPEKNISHEFKTTEIFKASDMMVDSLIKLLERERQKKAS